MEDRMAAFDPNDPALTDLGDWLFSAGGDEQEKIRTAREAFGRFFLTGPSLSAPTDSQRDAFDSLIDNFASRDEVELHYDLPYPKWKFLHHLTTRHGFLLHGSRLALAELEPRE